MGLQGWPVDEIEKHDDGTHTFTGINCTTCLGIYTSGFQTEGSFSEVVLDTEVAPEMGKAWQVAEQVFMKLAVPIRSWFEREVSKEHQQVFVVCLSEAVGVDLWLDGHFVRGEVDDAAAREGCQARLEEQVNVQKMAAIS